MSNLSPYLSCCLQAKRLVVLVDELYEKGVSLFVHSAAETPSDIFQGVFDVEEADTANAQDVVGEMPDVHPDQVEAATFLRRVDESQLSLSVVDAALESLRIACARAVSRMTQVCTRHIFSSITWHSR